MPEDSELETERLRDAIHEELEHEGGRFLKAIAVSTALFAAVAAIGSLQAGATVNEALALKTEATTLQAQASDQWAYYQAKGIKAAVQDATASSWTAIGKSVPPEYAIRQQRYTTEQRAIEKRARDLERERDQKSREAAELLHQHHLFANAVALLQVCIALSAVAALTRNRWIWYASLLLGVAGALLFLTPLIIR